MEFIQQQMLFAKLPVNGLANPTCTGFETSGRPLLSDASSVKKQETVPLRSGFNF
jgi:hypothetical protein